MPKECAVCAKRRVSGGSISRRGLAKKQGGIGTHVVKNVKRAFRPNLQSVRIRLNGTVKRAVVCVACIRSGAIEKA